MTKWTLVYKIKVAGSTEEKEVFLHRAEVANAKDIAYIRKQAIKLLRESINAGVNIVSAIIITSTTEDVPPELYNQ